ncbi:MAG: glycerophosphodiester phosphodiesterase [Acidimicrobiales bacterium]
MPPVIIAHRTAPLDAPENSLAGIRRSAELGADYVEIDVRLTRDGVPVMLHDALLLRTTGRPWPVSWATSRGLRRARLRGGGEHVPTFAEAVAALPDGLGMAIDTKAPQAAEAIVSELRNQGRLGRALLWAQSQTAVRWYAEHAGDDAAEVALLRDALTPEAIDQFLADAAACGATAISAHQDSIDEALLDRAHGLGLRVHCWFQDEATQRAKAHLPLDGIVTDWPVDARRLSGGRPG